MGKSWEERRKTKSGQVDNHAETEARARQFHETFGRHDPQASTSSLQAVSRAGQTGAPIRSRPSTSIGCFRLDEPGYAEVDHIIRERRCFDDSLTNKVLVLTSQNRLKGDCIPYEFFGHDPVKWAEFEALGQGHIPNPTQAKQPPQKRVRPPR